LEGGDDILASGRFGDVDGPPSKVIAQFAVFSRGQMTQSEKDAPKFSRLVSPDCLDHVICTWTPGRHL
jgi:hypothetical protein